MKYTWIPPCRYTMRDVALSTARRLKHRLVMAVANLWTKQKRRFAAERSLWHAHDVQ